MATYKYVAKDRKGKKVKGIRDAGGEGELKAILKREKLLMIKAKELDEKKGKKDRFKIVKAKDIAILTRELAAMLDGGVSWCAGNGRALRARVAENIRRFEAGEPLLNVVDFARGY